MTVYYVDDAGSATAPYDSWANAATSINQLDAAVALASGDIVYFAHDMQCQAVNVANLTITGPTTGLPVIFISATTGSNPPTYQQATGNQIDTTEGAYSVIFAGSFALYGIRVKSGAGISLNAGTAATAYAENCIFALGANATLSGTGTAGGGYYSLVDCVVDLTADGTTNRTAVAVGAGFGSVRGMTFINAAYRTGSVFNNGSAAKISGCDFSGFTNATLCEILSGNGNYQFSTVLNCKTAATWGTLSGTLFSGVYAKFLNCGSSDAPVSLYIDAYAGKLVSTTSIYRSGTGQIFGLNSAWLITTSAACSVDAPFYTEYIYGDISSTGSKTFDVYITNDTADLTDAEIWLEVEYKATAGSGMWSIASDKIASRTTTPVVQTDDVTSTWNGTGPTFTYKQKLSVTATVNVTGQYRARVCVGKASVSAASNLYIDPMVTVS